MTEPICGDIIYDIYDKGDCGKPEAYATAEREAVSPAERMAARLCIGTRSVFRGEEMPCRRRALKPTENQLRWYRG